ncbi:MAG: hypothetical protein WBF06_11360 [Candidatus Acidiferrales bacterium]
MAKSRKALTKVFLNIPYDKKFENLFLAYIAGISAFGLVPRATLEISSSSRRLEKILGLIGACRYSIHDLSRVELDSNAPRTPRFNMPFELGLSVAYHRNLRTKKHKWFVCESRDRRLLKSLSDLNGTDAHIHNGRIVGVFRELCNIFLPSDRKPTAQQMGKVYLRMRRSLPEILHKSGANSVYTARVFKELSVLAIAYADEFVPVKT